MKRKLVTVDAETLLFTPMSKTMFIVDELIPQGLPVWGIPTMQCDVLYLCLEDTERRIRDRSAGRIVPNTTANIKLKINPKNATNIPTKNDFASYFFIKINFFVSHAGPSDMT